MEKKLVFRGTILIVISFLIGLGVGYLTGKFFTTKTLQAKLAAKEKEIEWWKSTLEMFFPPLPQNLYSFSGKITKIEKNSIWVETQIRVSRLPLPEGKEFEKKEIKVNLTDETEILKVEYIPPEEPVRKTSLKLTELKVGDQINVISKENIKGKTEILADKIQLIP
jgi:hypothetical protein